MVSFASDKRQWQQLSAAVKLKGAKHDNITIRIKPFSGASMVSLQKADAAGPMTCSIPRLKSWHRRIYGGLHKGDARKDALGRRLFRERNTSPANTQYSCW
jgi:hypothetical protein